MIAADQDKVRSRRRAEAADAWTRGREALNQGDLAAARFWLERVGRIAPQDPRPRYELALVLAAQHDAAADAALHAIATEHDLAEAWLTLARLRHGEQRHHAAAEALTTLLRRHEIPPDPDFAAVADRIAAASGHPGWCGIAAGTLVVHPADAIVTLQGRSLAVSPHVEAALAGRPLLGSPLDPRLLRRITGLATTDGNTITGWVAAPAAPDRPPSLRLIDRNGTVRKLRPRPILPPDAPFWFLPRHPLRIGRATLQALQPPFRILGPDDQPLTGTPIDPAAIPLPARRPIRPPHRPPRAALCAVMPVYRDRSATLAALRSLQAGLPIIVIDDASPEPDLTRAMIAEARAGRIVLRRHRRNRGFPATANAGIRLARRLIPGCDILLLNADILLPPGLPARLQAALYADTDIASATPLSNEATILSYPARQGGNPAPDLAATIALDRLARRANRTTVIDIPTAIGFCMAIRHDALQATGGFDTLLFAQGYGEENDWCRRAAMRGFRHVALPGGFVAHHSATSFGTAGAALCARNLVLLEQRHPGYHALIAAHHAADPLRTARFRLDRARFQAAPPADAAVVLVSHDHGGGIARVVAARMATLRQSGLRPILIQPDFTDPASHENFIGAARLTDGAPADYPNLRYDVPGQWPNLIALLRRQQVRHVEFHHTLGHHPMIRTLPTALGVPAEHVVHDYAHFCKRVNLLGPGRAGEQRRYCGEPDIAGCTACIAAAGSELTDPIAPADLVTRSAVELHAARRVTAPSADAAARLRRHFPGLAITVTPWENDQTPLTLRPPNPAGHRIVAIAGGIGPAKGFDVLLGCARDAAARDLPLAFVLIGTSEDDAALIATGRVMITGAYQEGEAAGLIARTGAQLGFLPSIWPETWCFALSALWQAGLYAAAFDLGAQAARIKATGRGFLLPLGLPVAQINRSLLAWRPDLGDLNYRAQPVITKATPARSTN